VNRYFNPYNDRLIITEIFLELDVPMKRSF